MGHDTDDIMGFAMKVRAMRQAQRSARHPQGGVTREKLVQLEAEVDAWSDAIAIPPVPMPDIPPDDIDLERLTRPE